MVKVEVEVEVKEEPEEIGGGEEAVVWGTTTVAVEVVR